LGWEGPKEQPIDLRSSSLVGRSRKVLLNTFPCTPCPLDPGETRQEHESHGSRLLRTSSSLSGGQSAPLSRAWRRRLRRPRAEQPLLDWELQQRYSNTAKPALGPNKYKNKDNYKNKNEDVPNTSNYALGQVQEQGQLQEQGRGRTKYVQLRYK